MKHDAHPRPQEPFAKPAPPLPPFTTPLRYRQHTRAQTERTVDSQHERASRGKGRKAGLSLFL